MGGTPDSRAIAPGFVGLSIEYHSAPDGSLGWYETPAGVPVPGRSTRYGFGPDLRDYATVSRAIPRGVPLIGPASGSTRWLSGLGTYLSADPRVRLATFHRYPLHRCFTPRDSPEFPTISNLLAPAAATGPVTSLAGAVGVANARGIPLRADELNSVSCGGARGVSDTFASALWSLDALFNMARVGVDGVNIETFRNAIYQPFAVASRGGLGSAQVKPIYYGLLMFTEAAPPGARLLPTTFRAPATLRVWSTRAPDGRVRGAHQRLAAAGGDAGGPLARGCERDRCHRDPSAGDPSDATTGVSIGGRSFSAATDTGSLSRHAANVHSPSSARELRRPPAAGDGSAARRRPQFIRPSHLVPIDSVQPRR